MNHVYDLDNKRVNSIAVIIPTLNESGNIGILIKKIEMLSQYFMINLIIIDDGSIDGTTKIVEFYQNIYKNIYLVKRNIKGIGSALKEGFSVALESESLPDYLISMDADLSHDPDDIPYLLKVSRRNGIVIGSRYIKGGKIIGWSIFRRILSIIANLLASLTLQINIGDYTSGYRCYGNECIKPILSSLQSNSFEFQFEVLTKLTKRNIMISEYPIIFRNRQTNISKLNVNDILLYIKKIINTYTTK